VSKQPTADEIYAALAEEVKVGLAEVLLELTERRLKRVAARAESEAQGEQIEAKGAAKRSRRRRPERPDREV